MYLSPSLRCCHILTHLDSGGDREIHTNIVLGRPYFVFWYVSLSLARLFSHSLPSRELNQISEIVVLTSEWERYIGNNVWGDLNLEERAVWFWSKIAFFVVFLYRNHGYWPKLYNSGTTGKMRQSSRWDMWPIFEIGFSSWATIKTKCLVSVTDFGIRTRFLLSFCLLFSKLNLVFTSKFKIKFSKSWCLLELDTMWKGHTTSICLHVGQSAEYFRE